MQNYWQRTFSNHRIIIFACCFNFMKTLGWSVSNSHEKKLSVNLCEEFSMERMGSEEIFCLKFRLFKTNSMKSKEDIPSIIENSLKMIFRL